MQPRTICAPVAPAGRGGELNQASCREPGIKPGRSRPFPTRSHSRARSPAHARRRGDQRLRNEPDAGDSRHQRLLRAVRRHSRPAAVLFPRQAVLGDRFRPRRSSMPGAHFAADLFSTRSLSLLALAGWLMGWSAAESVGGAGTLRDPPSGIKACGSRLCRPLVLVR